MGFSAQRHVALHVAYFGEDYGGLATQANRNDTVEYHLHSALKKACLIDDVKTCRYSRCGRTDAGVSALGQIVTLTVRSNLGNPLPKAAAVPPEKTRPPSKKQKKDGEETSGERNHAGSDSDDSREINYPHILNRLLPKDIMVLGWAPAPSLDYKARFNAEKRTYRYYFCKRELDVEAMGRAAELLQGEHDFRNFCKMDVVNVANFVRQIYSAKIVDIGGTSKLPMAYLEIVGTAFLWHQIRCIVAILFMVGRGNEQPSIVTHLLDLKAAPAKPIYDPAAGEPLILYESEYPDLTFRYDAKALERVRQLLEYRVAKHEIKSKMTLGVIDFIDRVEKPALQQVVSDFPPNRKGVLVATQHQPLLERKACDSYEERLKNLSEAKRKQRKEIHGWD